MPVADIPRNPYCPPTPESADWTDVLTGEGLALLAKTCLPDAAQTREALLRLRREHRLSRGKLAAMLAVSPHTLRRWEEGKRKPCAPARRAVQLVERAFFRPGDFPVEPVFSVMSALQPDMRDSIGRCQQRNARASQGDKTSAQQSGKPQG